MADDGNPGTGGKLIYQELTEQIIGGAIEVHKSIGPGLLESAYEACLAGAAAGRAGGACAPTAAVAMAMMMSVRNIIGSS